MDDLRWMMKRLGWPSFIKVARARMMDQADIRAPSWSECGRVALTVDHKLTWPELVWQQIDVAEDVNQHVRGRLGAVTPIRANDGPNIPQFLGAPGRSSE